MPHLLCQRKRTALLRLLRRAPQYLDDTSDGSRRHCDALSIVEEAGQVVEGCNTPTHTHAFALVGMCQSNPSLAGKHAGLSAVGW